MQELVQGEENDKIDAILFSTSKLGIMGIEYISKMGIRVPEDLAIVSFDNPDAYKIFTSPIAVIEQPLDKIGKTAVQILLGKINQADSKDIFHKISLKTDFIAGQTHTFLH